MLAALLEVTQSDGAYRLNRIRDLMVIEEFPARGRLAVNVHESARLALRQFMFRQEAADFQLLSSRARALFETDRSSAGRIEWIYHLLCHDPDRGASQLESITRDLQRRASPEDQFALAVALRELNETNQVAGRSKAWALLFVGWNHLSRGELSSVAEIARSALRIATSENDPNALADAQMLLSRVLEKEGTLTKAKNDGAAIQRGTDQDPTNEVGEIGLANAPVKDGIPSTKSQFGLPFVIGCIVVLVLVLLLLFVLRIWPSSPTVHHRCKCSFRRRPGCGQAAFY